MLVTYDAADGAILRVNLHDLLADSTGHQKDSVKVYDRSRIAEAKRVATNHTNYAAGCGLELDQVING
jgi:hypothetical protein